MAAEESRPPFTRDDVSRMVEHMNDDHSDSVLAYAQHFGHRPDATAATLLDVTATNMRIQVETPDGAAELTVDFDHILESGHDAHMTMVQMSKTAKKALA